MVARGSPRGAERCLRSGDGRRLRRVRGELPAARRKRVPGRRLGRAGAPRGVAAAGLGDHGQGPLAAKRTARGPAVVAGRHGAGARVGRGVPVHLRALGRRDVVPRAELSRPVARILESDASGCVGTDARWLAATHPDDRAGVDEAARRLLASRPVDYEHRVRDRDGVERWMWVRERPEQAADGRLLVHGAMTDVTARKWAEGQLGEALEDARNSYAELSALHDQMQRIVGSIDELFYTDELRVDGSWHSTWIGDNFRRFIGDVEDGVDPQKVWDDQVHPEDRERYDGVDARILALEAVDLEYRLVGPDGAIRWVWERMRPSGAARREPGRRRGGAGHHRAQALGGAARGCARARRAGAHRGGPGEPDGSADGAREPQALRRAAQLRTGCDPSRAGSRAPAAGHRPFQAHERHVRSRGRRRGVARGRTAALRGRALGRHRRAHRRRGARRRDARGRQARRPAGRRRARSPARGVRDRAAR